MTTPPAHGILRAIMMQPLVHVLVINWNGLEHLEACYDSLIAQTYENARFVLLDNGSTDDSVEFVRQRHGHDSRVRILQFQHNLGWSGANNQGMEAALEAGADYVFLLNNDTALAPDCVEKLVALGETCPELGAIAPKIRLFHEQQILNSVGLECSIIGACWDRGLGRLDGPEWDAPVPAAGVCGGAMFLRAGALEKAGTLPVDYEIYLDDLDLCLRIWDAGYEIQTCPEADVRHKFSATMGSGEKLRRKYYLNNRNRWRLILRNWPLRHWPRAAALALVGETRAIGRALLDGEAWKAWLHVRSWLDALLYCRKAFPERRRNNKRGLRRGRFWPLIRTAPLFFPGTELPERGWYSERVIEGQCVRPIAREAWLETQGGDITLTLLNPYPALGAAEVAVEQEGRILLTLEARRQTEQRLSLAPGVAVFRARHIFRAEDTGERIDLGGCLRIEWRVPSIWR